MILPTVGVQVDLTNPKPMVLGDLIFRSFGGLGLANLWDPPLSFQLLSADPCHS